MKLTSLGRKTDLIFAKFSGEITEKEDYILVQTPSNPNFHWGNFLVFKNAPRPGDFKRWTQIFKAEFEGFTGMNHMTITWDSTRPGEVQEFIDEGFEFEEGIVLATNKLIYPTKFNSRLKIKKISSDREWEDAYQMQLLTTDEKYAGKEFEVFKKKQMAEYRAMSEQGLGNWFGAYLGEQIVGDLGIFYQEELARFQNVGTHPHFRRQGICQTLVYESAQMALGEYGVSTLVMEADANYHAAKIYESVGFKPVEKNYSLSWIKPLPASNI